ncbi:MAG TPA: hypothetical protein ACN46O_08905 [Prochlorococcus sp.]
MSKYNSKKSIRPHKTLSPTLNQAALALMPRRHTATATAAVLPLQPEDYR